jgi:Tetracyclin repressor-like, C-terminal domain
VGSSTGGSRYVGGRSVWLQAPHNTASFQGVGASVLTPYRRTPKAPIVCALAARPIKLSHRPGCQHRARPPHGHRRHPWARDGPGARSDVGKGISRPLCAPPPAIGGRSHRTGFPAGDLPAEVDEDLLIDLLSSPFFYRIFITGHRVDPDLAEKLVDFVLVRQIPKKAAARR